MDVNEALQLARTPGKQACPVCGEEYIAPMDKLSIGLYQKCVLHLPDDGHEANNLLTLAAHL